MIKYIVLYSSIILASGMLLTNVYNSVVDARIWNSEIPGSIETARVYFKTTSPAVFYQILGSALDLLGLLSIFLFWNSPIRWYLIAAFVAFVLVDVLTITYFFPRNEILFRSDPIADIEALKRACSEWSAMNWIRSLITSVGLIFSCMALHKMYRHL